MRHGCISSFYSECLVGCERSSRHFQYNDKINSMDGNLKGSIPSDPMNKFLWIQSVSINERISRTFFLECWLSAWLLPACVLSLAPEVEGVSAFLGCNILQLLALGELCEFGLSHCLFCCWELWPVWNLVWWEASLDLFFLLLLEYEENLEDDESLDDWSVLWLWVNDPASEVVGESACCWGFSWIRSPSALLWLQLSLYLADFFFPRLLLPPPPPEDICNNLSNPWLCQITINARLLSLNVQCNVGQHIIIEIYYVSLQKSLI